MTKRRALFDDLRCQAMANGFCPPVDLHLHTTWTDGKQSVSEMHDQGVTKGLSLMLFSEHARHTSGDWFPTFASEVRALPQDPCRTLVGCEVKINDFDGSLDVTPDIVSLCDYVMASVHRFPGESGIISSGGRSIDEAADLEFRLCLAATENPDAHILGHPFGMTVARFGGQMPWELVEQVIQACARTGTAFEINARYHTDPARLFALCVAAGAPVSFGSNAHSMDELGRLRSPSAWTQSSL